MASQGLSSNVIRGGRATSESRATSTLTLQGKGLETFLFQNWALREPLWRPHRSVFISTRKHAVGPASHLGAGRSRAHWGWRLAIRLCPLPCDWGWGQPHTVTNQPEPWNWKAPVLLLGLGGRSRILLSPLLSLQKISQQVDQTSGIQALCDLSWVTPLPQHPGPPTLDFLRYS